MMLVMVDTGLLARYVSNLLMGFDLLANVDCSVVESMSKDGKG